MKILIIKLGALGDLIATTPIFSKVKNLSAEYVVDHLVLDSYKSGTGGHPFVDNQIILNLNTGSWLTNFIELVNTILFIRRSKYDIAIILHRNFFFQIICLCSGIKRIVGFASKSNIFLEQNLEYRIDLNRTIQEFYLVKLAFPELGNAPTRLEFYPNNSFVDNKKFISLPQKFVACNPGGGNIHAPANNRMWPIEKYAQLIDSITHTFVIFGRGASDRALVDRLKSMTKKNFIDMVDVFSFDESAIALSKSLIYIGNDSSLLHLASSMGIPTIGLFGPTQVAAANPLGPQQFFIESLIPCSPCYDPRDGIEGKMYTCKDNLCMKSISVSEVVNLMNSKLNEMKDFGG